MFPSFISLRKHLAQIINEKNEQGHITTGLADELAALPDSYDAFHAFAKRVSKLPLRADWPYVEPSDLPGILAECDPRRPTGPTARVTDAAARVETAFLASCCGCVLGKPLEINPTLEQLQKAFSAINEWPISQYVSEKVRPHLPRPFHASWGETLRENIAFVSPDDDINYTILGMLNLEQHGIAFTKKQLKGLWTNHLPIATTFGPERTTLVKAGLNYQGVDTDELIDEWVDLLTPREEFCGALIRADAYGYACPADPALAAELAWRDASFTHRRTGIYGTMFVAAAIAAAQAQPKDPLDVIRTALMFVPQRSRLYHLLSGALDDVVSSSNWLDAYHKIHTKLHAFDHCRIYQELGTLINTLKFAENIPDGFCKQVMQGNDTDSFGATAGSLVGAYFGPSQRPLLDPWLKPFNDDLHTALAWFFERSLSKVAKRMSHLPALLEKQRNETLTPTITQEKKDSGAGI